MQASGAFGVLLSGGSVMDLDGTLFVQMGVFFVAFLVLRSLVFNPIMSLVDAREAAVGGAKVEADKMQTDAESRRDHFESEMRRVMSDANSSRDALRGEALQLARKLTEDARAQSVDAMASAKAKLDAEAEKIRIEARATIPGLANEIASKLLDRSVH